jgi:ribosomal protein S18 acetylase RimI-like enzyme
MCFSLIMSAIMSIILRPAQATDVSAAIPLIYSSGPLAFDYAFAHKTKGTAQQFLQSAFVDGEGEFGYKNHTVVTHEGKVVGIGTGFTDSSGLAFTLAAARQIFSFYGPIEAWGIIRRGLQVEGVIHPPSDKEQYIAHLGVLPEWQSKGIGAQLIEYFIAEAMAKGLKVASLDVSVINPRAQALYERMGFAVKTERQSLLKNEYGQVVNHRRMEKIL